MTQTTPSHVFPISQNFASFSGHLEPSSLRTMSVYWFYSLLWKGFFLQWKNSRMKYTDSLNWSVWRTMSSTVLPSTERLQTKTNSKLGKQNECDSCLDALCFLILMICTGLPGNYEVVVVILDYFFCYLVSTAYFSGNVKLWFSSVCPVISDGDWVIRGHATHTFTQYILAVCILSAWYCCLFGTLPRRSATTLRSWVACTVLF